ncbi:FAD-dependent oxidoreductase [Candidatus Margulisiibacteriota bacterium]
MYDLIIIGAGPAGITAGIYAARQKLKTLIVTENIGGQTAWSGTVENYTGFQLIPGAKLAEIFEEHAKKYSLEIKEKEKVFQIEKDGAVFKVHTKQGIYESKTAIVASGKISRKLGVPGEDAFRNKGVFYCAVCDGPLFADKNVAVVGGGNSALDAVLQLAKIAKKIYIVNMTGGLTGDPVFRDKIEADKKIEILNDCKVKEIKGDKFVKEMIVDCKGKEKKLDVKGIFVEIGLIPNSDLKIELKRDIRDEIIVDSKNQTNISGLFAAGDVTNVPEKQIVVAAGEGAKACLSAVKYLNSIKPKKEGNEMSKWKCLVCGYIYDPAQNDNVPFDKLPEDWVCPECGVGKDQFEEVQ